MVSCGLALAARLAARPAIPCGVATCEVVGRGAGTEPDTAPMRAPPPGAAATARSPARAPDQSHSFA